MNLVERNKIPFENLEFQIEMNEWIRLASDSIRKRHSRTRIGKVKHSRSDAKPVLKEEDYCYYTGIKFADAEQQYVNPNDPRKRSLDHKIPLAICYIKGMTMDEANHPDNLCWCLKVINNIRGTSDLESFQPIAEYYRRKFIEAGYASTVTSQPASHKRNGYNHHKTRTKK
jgi:hypothetical protein